MINPPKLNKAIGTAHSKVILIGEHAVVHEKPAIALPFSSLKVTVQLEEKGEGIFVEDRNFTGSIGDLPEKMLGLEACTYASLKSLNKNPKGLHMSIQSEIPIGRGLGSSAAIAIAIVRAIYNLYKKDLSHQKLMELVEISEKHAHGSPSGIDMQAASYDHPIWFRRNEPVTPLKISTPLFIVVADTGRIGETREAVASIKEKLIRQPEYTQRSIDLIGEYTRQAKKALLTGDILKLGKLLNAAQIQLNELGVSDPGINHLVRAAMDAGAIGAKLTGGGRGGCIIALTESEEKIQAICKALEKAGASNTWFCKVDKTMN